MDLTIDEIMESVKAELTKAMTQFPPFNSTHEGYAVILEELDELWEEIKLHNPFKPNHRMFKEAIQVAAMAIRFVHHIHKLR